MKHCFCTVCHKRYLTKAHNSVYCDECRAKGIKKKKEKAQRIKTAKSINDICRELAEYNRQNGTCISYGYFVVMKGY